MSENFQDYKIGIIGLGYVGLPLALEFGKIFDVIGYDISSKRIAELNNFEDITNELDKERFEEAKFLKFSNNKQDLCDINFFIITVPTPINKNKIPDLSQIKDASKIVAKYLKKKDIVVYESTVYPGCTEEACVPVLEKYSKLTFNTDFFCGYSPERINPGDKINTLTKIKKHH